MGRRRPSERPRTGPVSLIRKAQDRGLALRKELEEQEGAAHPCQEESPITGGGGLKVHWMGLVRCMGRGGLWVQSQSLAE